MSPRETDPRPPSPSAVTGSRTELAPLQPIPRLLPWLQSASDQFDAVALDVDGVLLKAHQPVRNAPELVHWLKSENVPFVLLTNDGCNSPQQKVASLCRRGFDLEPQDVISSGHALAELMSASDWAATRFFVMGSLGDPCYARLAGMQTTHNLCELPDCGAVIVGEKRYDWERTITAVLNFLVACPEAPLIVPNPDVFFPGAAGTVRLGSGAVAGMLQELCRRCGRDLEPHYLGKPFTPIFQRAHHTLEQRAQTALPRDRVLMVGDSIASDIEGGRNFGCRTALLLTGITTVEAAAQSPVTPDLLFAEV